MKDLKIRNNTVIHCETEQLAKEVCNVFYECGYEWCDGDRYIDKPEYLVHGDQTCYHPFVGCVYSLKYSKEYSYQILPAIDFLKLHGYKIVEKETIVAFDLEKARAGARVVKGKTAKNPARIVCYDFFTEHYSLIVLTEGGVLGEGIGTYTAKGNYEHQTVNPNQDLFIIESTLKIIPPQIKEMSIEEIEKQLGHKVKIINK